MKRFLMYHVTNTVTVQSIVYVLWYFLLFWFYTQAQWIQMKLQLLGQRSYFDLIALVFILGKYATAQLHFFKKEAKTYNGQSETNYKQQEFLTLNLCFQHIQSTWMGRTGILRAAQVYLLTH